MAKSYPIPPIVSNRADIPQPDQVEIRVAKGKRRRETIETQTKLPWYRWRLLGEAVQENGDVILSLGAISVGEYDEMVRKQAEKIGYEKLFNMRQLEIEHRKAENKKVWDRVCAKVAEQKRREEERKAALARRQAEINKNKRKSS